MFSQQPQEALRRQTNRQWLGGLLIGGLIAAALIRRFGGLYRGVSQEPTVAPTSAAIGRLLLGDMLVPFEAVSLVLLAALVGTAQGGIQALSRSFFGKLVPPESANEFFGFYDIFGKFSAVLGPFLFGLVWDATQKSYLGVIPVLLMFVVGGGLFLLVPKNIEKLTSSRQD
jgi:MFS-type transporter involved in bile tolerance (Atg22 family)